MIVRKLLCFNCNLCLNKKVRNAKKAIKLSIHTIYQYTTFLSIIINKIKVHIVIVVTKALHLSKSESKCSRNFQPI